MDHPTVINKSIGFIGAGNMAFAIANGIINSGIIKPQKIFVSAPSDSHLPQWTQFGATTTNDNGEVIMKAGYVFLAMKPQFLKDAMDSVAVKCQESRLFISIIAGITTEDIYQAVKDVCSTVRIIRVMPNTPFLVGIGCTVFCGASNPQTKPRDYDLYLVKHMFSSGGLCEEVPESLINSVGALAGSGPAYVYLVIEALSDAGVKMGIPRSMATKFAAQTVMGAGKMVLETGKHPGQLKDEVCSPGGTTICGIHELEKGGVRGSLMLAVEAAANRSSKLGSEYLKS